MVSPAQGVAAALSPLSGKDFLSSEDASADQTAALLDLARQLKSGERRIDLGNRVLGLIFTKASTRTRVSFQVAMARLGGQTVDLNPQVTSGQIGLTISAVSLTGFIVSLRYKMIRDREIGRAHV